MPLPEEEILAGAEARIRKYRRGEFRLRVVDRNGMRLQEGSKVIVRQVRHKFLFGSNIFKLGRCRTPADNEAYAKHFDELLNFATLPFYWWGYEREQGKPDWAGTQKMLDWCREHRVTTKGHPLAWNWMDPKWLPDNAERVMKLQLNRIRREVGHFKGKIDIWDVVNEATHYDRPGPKQQAPKLTALIAEAGVGEYLRQAFKAAREANPDATLLINDYRTDADYENKVIKELVDENGKPLYDVIGIQCHQHGGAWSAKQTWDICERFAKYGVPLHFTEATILSGMTAGELQEKRKSDPNLTWKSTPEGEARQAREVARFYTVLFSHPAVEAITWWDFTDQNSWQGAPAGFLRDDMTPKPAYTTLHDLIKEKWWTPEQELTVGKDGEVTFRGFYGRYSVEEVGGSGGGEFRVDEKTTGTVDVELKFIYP